MPSFGENPLFTASHLDRFHCSHPNFVQPFGTVSLPGLCAVIYHDGGHPLLSENDLLSG
jgi:hypothetical protein